MIMPILMGNPTTMNKCKKAQEKMTHNNSSYKISKVLKSRKIR